MKIIFDMVLRPGEQPKHSSRFDIDRKEQPEVFDGKGEPYVAPPFDLSTFKPSFYIPKPFAQNAKRIRVTLEEL